MNYRRLGARHTLVELLAPADPESHNAQHNRRTDDNAIADHTV